MNAVRFRNFLRAAASAALAAASLWPFSASAGLLRDVEARVKSMSDGGEGVVGLTQAFLVAGANGLSVSLWQVPDESTARFMQELYRLHQAGTHDWPSAITAVKRRFIKGEFGAEWKDPHYWAPFVYYGG